MLQELYNPQCNNKVSDIFGEMNLVMSTWIHLSDDMIAMKITKAVKAKTREAPYLF